MPPENTTPEPIVNGTPSLAAQLQAPAKKKHTGIVLAALSIVAFGVAAYGYLALVRKDTIETDVARQEKAAEQTDTQPEFGENSKTLDALNTRLDALATDSQNTEPASEEELNTRLDALQKDQKATKASGAELDLKLNQIGDSGQPAN